MAVRPATAPGTDRFLLFGTHISNGGRRLWRRRHNRFAGKPPFTASTARMKRSWGIILVVAGFFHLAGGIKLFAGFRPQLVLAIFAWWVL